MRGGLGNQMFAYAFAKKLSTLGYEVCIDASDYGIKGKGHQQYIILEDGRMHHSIRKLEIIDFEINLPFFYATKSEVTKKHLKNMGLKIEIFLRKILNQILRYSNLQVSSIKAIESRATISPYEFLRRHQVGGGEKIFRPESLF